MSRLAFIDLMFSWPPHGGADVDLYETVAGLQALGHKVHLFYPDYPKSDERGCVEPGSLPFPATGLPFDWRTFTPRHAPARFRAAVDAFRPDAVVLGHGYFLKPFIADALSHYPMIARYYAYELVCPRDALLFKDGAPCPNNYLRTPDVCRRCALAQLKPRLTAWRMVAWTQEYIAARAFLPGFHHRLCESVRKLDAIIVSNSLMHDQIASVNEHIHILPGGVNLDRFVYRPKDAVEMKTIIVSGRLTDPMKGLDVLWEAGRLLAEQRHDFHILATDSDHARETDWFKPVGWQNHDGLTALHRQADICVVPSIWEEPFGLAAVEAMAVGRPVVASRVGGLQHIVRDGATGFLFDRANAAGLARQLARLLDDETLRGRMGEAGRRLVEEEYDWARVIAKYWPPLLEGILS